MLVNAHGTANPKCARLYATVFLTVEELIHVPLP